MIVEIYDNQEFVFVKRYFYDYDNTLICMVILSIFGGKKIDWGWYSAEMYDPSLMEGVTRYQDFWLPVRYFTIILMVSSTGCQRIVCPCLSQWTRPALRSSLMWWEIVDREILKLLATLQTQGRISSFRDACPNPMRICSKTLNRVSFERALKAATTRSVSFANFPFPFFSGIMITSPGKDYFDDHIVIEIYHSSYLPSILINGQYFILIAFRDEFMRSSKGRSWQVNTWLFWQENWVRFERRMFFSVIFLAGGGIVTFL